MKINIGYSSVHGLPAVSWFQNVGTHQKRNETAKAASGFLAVFFWPAAVLFGFAMLESINIGAFLVFLFVGVIAVNAFDVMVFHSPMEPKAETKRMMMYLSIRDNELTLNINGLLQTDIYFPLSYVRSFSISTTDETYLSNYERSLNAPEGWANNNIIIMHHSDGSATEVARDMGQYSEIMELHSALTNTFLAYNSRRKRATITSGISGHGRDFDTI